MTEIHKYIVVLTSNSLQEKSITIDEVAMAIIKFEGTEITGRATGGVTVDYAGSTVQLQEGIGYDCNEVFVEKLFQYTKQHINIS